ncbi:MAG: flavin reductase family protein [Bacteroidota bacterium]
MKQVIPKEMTTRAFHALMLSAVAPRPIAFASTIDTEGQINLSPFSFFNAFGSNPPLLIFSPARRVRNNTTKHTLQNVEEVPEVVINIVNYAMVEQMSLASTEYDQGVNEFVKAGLTPATSSLVKPPRVVEAPVAFECKVNQVIHTGQEGGAGNLILCEILMMHVKENILDEEGRIDQHKIDLVARLGGSWYCRASGEALFEIPKPLTTKGVGVDSLPQHVLNSTILTGNNLGRLGNVEKQPTKEEVAAYSQQEEIKKIQLQTKDSKATFQESLHQLAKKHIEANRLKEAWLTLLQM